MPTQTRSTVFHDTPAGDVQTTLTEGVGVVAGVQDKDSGMVAKMPEVTQKAAEGDNPVQKIAQSFATFFNVTPAKSATPVSSHLGEGEDSPAVGSVGSAATHKDSGEPQTPAVVKLEGANTDKMEAPVTERLPSVQEIQADTKKPDLEAEEEAGAFDAEDMVKKVAYEAMVEAAAPMIEQMREQAKIEHAELQARNKDLATANEVLVRQLEQLKTKVDLLSSTAASTPSTAKVDAASPGITPDMNTFGEVLAEKIGDAMGTLAKAIVVEQKQTLGTPRKIEMGKYDGFDFMDASKCVALAYTTTSVTIGEAMQRKPDASTKPAIQAAHDACGPKELFEGLDDKIAHQAFIDLRRKIVSRLGGWGLYLSESMDKMAAEHQLRAKVIDSMEYFDGKEGRTKLSMALAQSKAKVGASLKEVLELIDEQFAAATPVERNREHQEVLNELTVEHGICPSTTVAKSLLAFQRKFGADHDDLVDTEARSFVTQLLEGQAAKYAFMQPFMDKINDCAFAGKSLNDWITQFKILERQSVFTTAMAALKKKMSKQAAPAPTSTQINALLGFLPQDLEAPEADEDGSTGELIKRMAGLLTTGRQDDLTKPGEKGTNDQANLKFLTRLIAAASSPAAGGKGSSTKDSTWVAEHGVPGFPAPADSFRPAIHVGKVLAAWGQKAPDGCPKDPHALVGPTCPCNLIRQLPDDAWYYSPQSDEFKSGKPEFCRIKPADLKAFGYYHKLGKCKTIYAKAHEIAHADPTKIDILVPLAKGVKDCLTVG
ncbi:MAG: hypothetical protein CBB72_005200 [Muricauda sp. TMED12]|nr:MAG: hypothetical protein CBB72_005200 [Muricauda sp. TMED12]